MPKLEVKKASEVPAPTRASRAVREQQRLYDDFVKSIDAGGAGELQLESGETIRAVKVRLRRASTRVAIDLDIWDVDGRVYFRRLVRRGRPRKQG